MQSVVPSEVYLHEGVLRVNGAAIDDVAASLRDYRYRQNIGPYVPVSAIEQDLLDNAEFSAVFSSDYLLSHAATGWSGTTIYTGMGVDQGIPGRDLYS